MPTVPAPTLTDSVRIPLHSLHADSDYLIGRVIADGSAGPMVVATIRERLDAIEKAILEGNDTVQPSMRPDQSPATASFDATALMREALVLAEDVLSRAPFSNQIWPNGMHPSRGIEQIRTALAAPQPTARADREAIETAIGKINSNAPSKFMQWCGDRWRTYYAGFDLSEFAVNLVAALATHQPNQRGERVMELEHGIRDLHRVWFKGADLDKDAISQQCLKLFQLLPNKAEVE